MKRTTSSLVFAGALAAGVARADSDEEMGRRVQELLRAHQAEVFECVSKQPHPVEGEALLQVVVGRGVASKVSVLKSDGAEAGLVAACVAAAARAWDLSSLRAGEGDQIVFPLAFHPGKPAASPADGAVQARLRKLALRKGAHQAERVSHPTAWYVLDGAVSLRLEASRLRAQAGDVAFLGSEGSVELVAETAAELIVVESAAPPAASGGLVVRGAASTPPLSVAGGKGTARLFLDGVPAPFALDQLCAKRGAEVPRHEHAADELLYIVKGRGETTLGERTDVEKAGAFVTIPKGTPHALRVIQDLCAVQVYAPAGPEQRFKQQQPTR